MNVHKYLSVLVPHSINPKRHYKKFSLYQKHRRFITPAHIFKRIFHLTYHHHECKNPGGSPRVMFFSHRICEALERGFFLIKSLFIHFQVVFLPLIGMFALPFVHQHVINIRKHTTPT